MNVFFKELIPSLARITETRANRSALRAQFNAFQGNIFREMSKDAEPLTREVQEMKTETFPLGRWFQSIQQRGRYLDLREHTITRGAWNAEGLQKVFEAMKVRDVPPETAILPRGKDLQHQPGWVNEFLSFCADKGKPVANFFLSTEEHQSEDYQSFPGNNTEGLKALAQKIKEGKQIPEKICLRNLKLSNPEIRDALTEIMTLPQIKHQELGMEGTPIGLKAKLFEADKGLGGLLELLRD